MVVEGEIKEVKKVVYLGYKLRCNGGAGKEEGEKGE